MIDKIEAFIRENAQDLVVNNSQIPNEQNENVIQAASGSIVEVLKEKMTGGNMGDLISSFTQGGGTQAKALVENVQSSFSSRLETLGLGNDTVKSLAASLIPLIMSKFFSQGGQGAGFNVQDILGKLAGGADGKFDLNDIAGMFGKDSKEGEANGGLLDKLKGFL